MRGRQAVAVATMALGLWVGVTTEVHGQGADASLALVIQLRNFARVAPGDVKALQREVERIFRSAGVGIRWHEPDAHVSARGAEPGRPIVVDLIRGATLGPDGTPAIVLGQAARETDRAWVFVNRVRTQASNTPVDVNLLLARVVAHEIGHLLLPAGVHGERGLMQACMDIGQLAFDRFTSGEAAIMRAALDPRRERADASNR
jgi:hypothetical protein